MYFHFFKIGIDTNILANIPTLSNLKVLHRMTDPLRTTQWSSKEVEDYRRYINGLKVMARIENGIPPTFRRHMWLILANRSIQLKRLDWQEIVNNCLNESCQQLDEEDEDEREMNAQIIKVSEVVVCVCVFQKSI